MRELSGTYTSEDMFSEVDMRLQNGLSWEKRVSICTDWAAAMNGNGNGNGLLFHMTQPISRSTIKAIACSKPTISEH